MDIRLFFSIVFIALSGALGICAAVALRSKKEIGRSLGFMLLSLIPPVAGNFLIIFSTKLLPATVGCYFYYIGIDFTALCLLNYVSNYCKISRIRPGIVAVVLGLFAADIAQLLANTVFGHAFGIEEIELYGKVYYRMIPYLPQNLHRLLVYLTLGAALVILFVKMVHSSRIHARRYEVIFTTMLAVMIWCSFYVISRTPMDRSMIGYAVFGLLAFYFSLYYKPTRLLNKIMVDISAELPNALFFFDDAGACIWANREGVRLAGVGEGDLSGVREKLAPFQPEGKTGDSWTSCVVLQTQEGPRYYEVEKRTIRDGRGYIDGSFLSVRDDTQAQVKLQQEVYRGRHDDLTGLFSRPYLYQRIEDMLSESAPGTAFNLVFLNVCNFKLINDIFGNAFGDEVLKQIAALLRKQVPESGVCGRLAGDTFGIFLPAGAVSAEQAEALLSGFSVRNGEIEYRVLIHLGVYEVTDDSVEVSAMFDRARIATSSIRNDFHTHIAYYDENMRNGMVWEQEITSDLGKALRDRQIMPYLQPLVNVKGQIVGAEALVRWNHPKYGFLSPAAFVPLFEKNGMIAEVDRYMWRRACELLKKWPDKELFISINISPKDFYFADVVSEIRGLVKEYGIEPSRLRIEITESVMISDVDNRVKSLRDFQRDGFVVEMDDFGSGYSSLNMLKDMPIDVIKIDMGFLRSAEHDERSIKILRNIIQMATDLGIVPLTEGVETREQYEDLSEMGCKLFQGYYFDKPIPVEEFERRYIAQ